MTDLPQRITLRRTRGWRMPASAINVARPTMWGNPWQLGRPGRVSFHRQSVSLLLTVDISRHDAAAAYRLWLDGDRPRWLRPSAPTFNEQGWQRFWMAWEDARHAILQSLPALRRRPLACWCPPGCPCHADVLLDLANR